MVKLLVIGSILGIFLGLVMILAFIVPAIRERRREENQQDQTPPRVAHQVPARDDDRQESGMSAATARELSLSREEIWNRGCRGEALEDAEQEEFGYLARARFHTFQMGISHAESVKDKQKSTLLIRGMAIELFESPGLERLWHESSASEEASGQAVSQKLIEIQREQ